MRKFYAGTHYSGVSEQETSRAGLRECVNARVRGCGNVYTCIRKCGAAGYAINISTCSNMHEQHRTTSERCPVRVHARNRELLTLFCHIMLSWRCKVYKRGTHPVVRIEPSWVRAILQRAVSCCQYLLLRPLSTLKSPRFTRRVVQVVQKHIPHSM